MQRRMRAVLMRGGTSRGLFFRQEELPADPQLRDRVIQAAYGSPDPYARQVDGLGGATSLTSKVAIIGRPSVPDADVDYTFGQVGITTTLIDYKSNCGNICSAVGPYAIDEGMVPAVEPITTVRIYNTNTRKIIVARVPVRGGQAEVEGDYAIDGVPGTAARVALEFESPGGAVTGALLPTGQPRDMLEVAGLGRLEVSFVDAANPLVFARAADLGLAGVESPDEIDGGPGLLGRIEAVRAAAAVRLGLVERADEATAKSPAVPKMTLVSPPAAYTTISGSRVEAESIDLVGRIMSMQKTHRAYALTGAICTAVAACIEGTVVHEMARPWPGRESAETRDVRLGHPSGVLEVGARVINGLGGWWAEKAVAYRTARRLMEGYVYVPESVYRVVAVGA